MTLKRILKSILNRKKERLADEVVIGIFRDSRRNGNDGEDSEQFHYEFSPSALNGLRQVDYWTVDNPGHMENEPSAFDVTAYDGGEFMVVGLHEGTYHHFLRGSDGSIRYTDCYNDSGARDAEEQSDHLAEN